MLSNLQQAPKPIKVLVVDDSAVVRRIFTQELSKYDGIEIVGGAIDPYVAREKILRLKPDVITLDIEMPRMDGLSFLAKLMKHYPLPVIICSSLAAEQSPTALRALQMGAVEVISKPTSRFSTPDILRLVRAIRAASLARVERQLPANQKQARLQSHDLSQLETTHKILAIGASTGGTVAIERVLRELPPNMPGTVLVQHMPADFTASFAERLDRVCRMRVREASDGDTLVPGLALLAPGNRHMLLQRSGARYYVQIKDGPPVHHQRPAVDVLFYSVARQAGQNAVGVILTGMGADGAKGMLAMKESGAFTLAQDEASCVVFGMPKEAIQTGAAGQVVPLISMPKSILDALSSKRGVKGAGR